jgi:phosphoenolpyruvate carboxykinase (GTP)
MMETPIKNKALLDWVRAMADLCGPDEIFWCDGSEDEKRRLTKKAVDLGEVEMLDPEKLPGCLYARSQENDVARVEKRTFICTNSQRDAGPTNNWMAPAEAYQKLTDIFRSSMAGRTMYVVPYIMGIPGSSFNKVGIELTDSLYVVLNMRIMTRMGKIALDELGDSSDFSRGLHGKADLDEKRRFICHFPEDNTVWSVGSNYGGNVLLGKKCLALRLASWLGRKEGWLAEHMMIMGIKSPQGEIRYVAAAFPSQCGKTNLAMLVPPLSMKGYRVWTVGDDIAWMRIGEDGRLWAINPEAGFFGVAPGTNLKSNPNAMETVKRNTIFTNVVKTKDNTVWWEGMDGNPPVEGRDWRGRRWTPDSGEKGAHPNSRFTAPAGQCPSISPERENPKGVPISAIIFGGRRAHVAPLVYQSFSWQHGVYVGATMASETTAAATGKVGVVRRDPMAMLPFCGYNMGDYFGHWLQMGARMKRPPAIFHVNWFRKDKNDQIVWPGFGENLRVLDWILRRSERSVDAVETPIGAMPHAKDIHLDGLDFPSKKLEDNLLSLDLKEWVEEVKSQDEFFKKLGDSLPAEIKAEKEALLKRLEASRDVVREGS